MERADWQRRANVSEHGNLINLAFLVFGLPLAALAAWYFWCANMRAFDLDQSLRNLILEFRDLFDWLAGLRSGFTPPPRAVAPYTCLAAAALYFFYKR